MMMRGVAMIALLYVVALSIGHAGEQKIEIPNGPETPEQQHDPGPTVGVATMRSDGTIGIQFRVVSRSGAIGDSHREYKPDDPRYAEVKRFLGDIKPGEAKSFTLPRE
jgi:hypothetical protein